jgi:hypothetical protein
MTTTNHLRWIAAIILAIAIHLPASHGRADVEPEQLRELYDKLSTPAVDTSRSLDAAGLELDHEGLHVVFAAGDLVPVQRSDGRQVGLIFLGSDGTDSATLTFTAPEGEEQRQLERFCDASPCSRGLSAAWILATDESLDGIVADREWGAPPDAATRATELHSKRWDRYSDPLWDDWGPSLEMDVLEDLFGEGFEGGHLLAEFRTAPGQWLTYHHNPRGALFPTEEVALFTHEPRGDAPQEIHVWSSHPSAGSPDLADKHRVHDLLSVDLAVAVTGGGLDLNLNDVAITAHVTVAARTNNLKGVTLELQGRMRRTLGDEEWGEFDVQHVHAPDGSSLPAIQDRNRLFVMLPEPLFAGEEVTLEIAYSGALIQPCASNDGANLYYTPLERFAWYPRSRFPDPHTFAATVETPRALRAVTTGDLVSDTLEGTVRTVAYREANPVLFGALVVGDLGIVEAEHDGTPIRLYTTIRNKQDTKRAMKQLEGMLAFNEALWGSYPFSALNVVDSNPGCSCRVMTGLDTGYLYAHERDDRGRSGLVHLDFVNGVPIQAIAGQVADQWWGSTAVAASYRERWITSGVSASTARLFMAQFVSRTEYTTLNTRTQQVALLHSPPGTVLTGIRNEKYYHQAAARGSCAMEMLLGELGGDRWVKMMGELYQGDRDGGITHAEFEALAERYMGRRAAPFVQYWLDGREIPGLTCNYTISEAEDGTWRVEGTLTFDGAPPPNAIPVKIGFGKAEPRAVGVFTTGPETPFSVEGLETKPRSVTVDPEHVILLKSRRVAGH